MILVRSTVTFRLYLTLSVVRVEPVNSEMRNFAAEKKLDMPIYHAARNIIRLNGLGVDRQTDRIKIRRDSFLRTHNNSQAHSVRGGGMSVGVSVCFLLRAVANVTEVQCYFRCAAPLVLIS